MSADKHLSECSSSFKCIYLAEADAQPTAFTEMTSKNLQHWLVR